jgi:arsenate reductase (thioredoxin)
MEQPMPDTVLFLCPHNAAKSVLAEAYFNQMAQKAGLPFIAESAGTEPSEAVSPVVAAMLATEGIDVSQRRPRRVTAGELNAAALIVAMGCTPEELQIAPERVEVWADIPTVSQEPKRAQSAIRQHVERLIADLRGLR